MAKINIQAGPSTGGGSGNLQLLSAAAMSATLTAVTDTANTQSPLKLSTTGVQSTSKIQITTSDTNYIDAEDNSGNNRFTVGRGVGSQLVTVDFASVPTALTTPVGAIRTATDGVNLVNVQTFLENGNIGLGTDTPGSKLDVHSTGAIVAQFNKTVSGNSYIQQLMAGTARWKQGFTTATGAFDIIDDVNALTRLSLLNTGQLKLNAYTSTSAFTGTTAGFLAFDASGNILSVTSPATSPAGTTGAVQFNNAGAFGADSTNFFWDDTNKRLGVGTNAPAYTLDILSGGTYVAQFSNSVGKLGLGYDANGGFLIPLTSLKGTYLYNNSGNSFIGVSGAGGVGVNTLTPSGAFHIKGSGATSATTSLLVQNSAGTTSLQITDSNLLCLGGTTSSFPAIKRNGATIDFRLADDSNYCNINVQRLSTNVGSGIISFTINGGTLGTYFSHTANSVNTFDIGSEFGVYGSGNGTDAAFAARSGRVLYLGANGAKTMTLNSTKVIFLNSINAVNLATSRPATVGEFYQDTAANILANGDKVVGIRQ
jgi:hypothetical protein